MKIVEVIQGSQEWHDLRAGHFTASEAPAMAGVSKYQTRSDLLKQKYTGVAAEVTAGQQRIFDRGHAAEAAARPMAEEIIGQELYPVTGISDHHPHLLASLDGCTMLEDIIFEHKLYNADLAAAVESGNLPEHYRVQMDQQLLVSGADKCLFMVSDGTRENCVWGWYRTTPYRIDQLLAGWDQFREDLDAYQPTDEEVKPEGKAPDSLPALSINLTGGVQASNLPDFKAAALSLIDSIKTELVTDQDFSDAESAVKWLQKGEKQLQSSKKAALEQTADINALFETIDELSEQMRQKRLALEKMVKAEKTNRRNQIQRDAEQAFRDWMDSQESPVRVESTLDVAFAMKGKKTISTLQSAADDEVARAKVDASQKIERLKSNAKLLDDQSVGYEFLFSDRQQLLAKAPDDLASTIKARVAEHKEAEQKRQEAERERIRKEEEARVAEEAKPKAAAPSDEPAMQSQSPDQNEPEHRKPIDTSRLTSAAEAFQRGSDLKKPEEVTISRKEYDQLLADQSRLYALLNAGVERWDGFEKAMQAA